MSLAPRCPQCRIPMRVVQLCVVCEAGVPVQRLAPRAVEPLSPSGLLAALQVLWTIEDEEVAKPAQPPAAEPKRERVIRTELVTLPCETPGCTQQATYSSHGLLRLRGKGQPARCYPCRQHRRKTTLTEAWSRYKTKHFA